ncbi:hypothetical protein U9M48_022072 [Paspalum notatum var. saurae]|uniref:Kinesin motor domain-containing protein n=1 Tax=Paspalum notatum var. saurae TaxID=547442 RepID=A0AAQ3TM60_PASNO
MMLSIFLILSLLSGCGINIEDKGKAYSFSYDKVFGPEAKQLDLYEEIAQLVQSSLDSFQICIFAYGQTGSGKTFTMIGTSQEQGMIPRSADDIFDKIHSLETWSYDVHVSVAELYLHTLYDLLAPDKGKVHDLSALSEVLVSNKDDAITLLEKAFCKRSVSCTMMNEESSGSHLLFRLRLSGSNKDTGPKLGVLNFMDLAESKNVIKSGSLDELLWMKLSHI